MFSASVGLTDLASAPKLHIVRRRCLSPLHLGGQGIPSHSQGLSSAIESCSLSPKYRLRNCKRTRSIVESLCSRDAVSLSCLDLEHDGRTGAWKSDEASEQTLGFVNHHPCQPREHVRYLLPQWSSRTRGNFHQCGDCARCLGPSFNIVVHMLRTAMSAMLQQNSRRLCHLQEEYTAAHPPRMLHISCRSSREGEALHTSWLWLVGWAVQFHRRNSGIVTTAGLAGDCPSSLL